MRPDPEARQLRVGLRTDRLEQVELVLDRSRAPPFALRSRRGVPVACRSGRGRARRRRAGWPPRRRQRAGAPTVGRALPREPARAPGPSCRRRPRPASAARRASRRRRTAAAGCVRAAGSARSSSRNDDQRASKATDELTSSSTSTRGGSPASTGCSESSRWANEWSVPMAAPSSWSRASPAARPTVAVGVRLGRLLQFGPDAVAQLGPRLFGEGDGGDAPELDVAARHQRQDPLDQGGGLPGSGAGLDEQRGVEVARRSDRGPPDRAEEARATGICSGIREPLRLGHRGGSSATGPPDARRRPWPDRPACARTAGAARSPPCRRDRRRGTPPRASCSMPSGEAERRPPRSRPRSALSVSPTCASTSGVTAVSDALEATPGRDEPVLGPHRASGVPWR